MTIPVDVDDSDVVISGALIAAKKELLARGVSLPDSGDARHAPLSSPFLDAFRENLARGGSLTHDEAAQLLDAHDSLMAAYHDVQLLEASAPDGLRAAAQKVITEFEARSCDGKQRRSDYSACDWCDGEGEDEHPETIAHTAKCVIGQLRAALGSAPRETPEEP